MRLAQAVANVANANTAKIEAMRISGAFPSVAPAGPKADWEKRVNTCRGFGESSLWLLFELR